MKPSSGNTLRENEENKESKFTTFLPVADSNHFKNYKEAFDTILNKPVFCVAVSGSYGAGKSSLIRSFIDSNQSRYEFLPISLATFKSQEESNSKQDNQNIEKSIFQQLIYGVSSNELPLSRYRRIRKPAWSLLKATLVITFLLAIFLIWKNFDTVFWSLLEQPLSVSYPTVIILTYSLAVLIWLSFSVHKIFFGLSIKKISLKNGEIETSQDNTESIFNKHLDEIIYFFQETNYDFVIIEDLDRFGETEIFSKLREICLLINSNKDISEKRNGKNIKFVFAVKDDLFTQENRTKFFDYIIPVIPFINGSNSYEILNKKIEAADLSQKVDKKILRDVSIYIHDNRLLLNTVNEFILYEKNLGNPSLDLNKLFAVVLYKNFYPKDFDDLHRGEGIFAAILSSEKQNRKSKTSELQSHLVELDEIVKNQDKTVLRDQQALVSAYWGEINRQANLQYPISKVQSSQHGSITFKTPVEECSEFYKKEHDQISCQTHHGHSQNVKLKKIGEVVHPAQSFEEKISEIEMVALENRTNISAKREQARKALIACRNSGLHELLSFENLSESASGFPTKPDIFIYLVTNGYLSSDYFNYTSYFHEGAITEEDQGLILRIQALAAIDFTEKVDRPEEVLGILDERAFAHPSSFLVSLVDFVFGNMLTNEVLAMRLIDSFKSFPEESLNFLKVYFEEGDHVDQIVSYLIENWKAFLNLITEREMPAHFIGKVFEFLPSDSFEDLPDNFKWYLSQHSAAIFNTKENIERIPLLNELGVKLDDIAFDSVDSELRGIANEYLLALESYQINTSNICNLLRWYDVDEQNVLVENYSAISNLKDNRLKNYIDENITKYASSCFLEIADTKGENYGSVIELLGRILSSGKSISKKICDSIIARQDCKFLFKDTPKELWPIVLEHKKQEIDWGNFNFYMETHDDSTPLIEFIVQAESIDKLKENRVEISDTFFSQLIEAEEIPDSLYHELISPELGSIAELPEDISNAKKSHLIETRMVELNDSSYQWVHEDSPLLCQLIIGNQKTYFATPEDFPINNDDIELMLGKFQSIHKNVVIAHKIEESSVSKSVTILTEFLKLSINNEFPIADFSYDLVRETILNPKGDLKRKTLLLTRVSQYYEEEQIMALMADLEEPLSDIAQYGSRPLLEKNSENSLLIETLKERGFVSSSKIESKGIRVNTKKGA